MPGCGRFARSRRRGLSLNVSLQFIYCEASLRLLGYEPRVLLNNSQEMPIVDIREIMLESRRVTITPQCGSCGSFGSFRPYEVQALKTAGQV